MSVQLFYRLRTPALLIVLATAFPVLSCAAGAANVDFAAGSVTAVSAAGVQRPLSKGAEIGNGDTIRTGEGGRAQVRFSDGAMVSLQPQTDFRVDNYQYSGTADGQEKGFFSLLKGGLRTITGLVGRTNRDNYKVTTGVATIGIRGTEYSAGLSPTGDNLTVATGEGLVEVCNGAGCVVLASGESGIVSGLGALPRRTQSHPQLPPAQPDDSLLPAYSAVDTRTPDGSLNMLALTGSEPTTTLPPLTGTQTYSTVYGNVGGFGPASEKGVGIGTIDLSGVLTAFEADEGPADPNIAGENSVQSLGNDGIVAWGRWVNNGSGFGGSLGGTDYGSGYLHYVTGVPTADSQVALGPMSGTYTLLGGGVAGSISGLGSVTSASMTVNFTTAMVTALSVGMTLASKDYNVAASGLSITGFGSAVVFSGTGSVSGSGCGAGCSSAHIKGAFFGAGAPRAGVAFKFDDSSQYIAGAVALKK